MSREDWERREKALKMLEECMEILEDMLSDLEERIDNLEVHFASHPQLEVLESRRDCVDEALRYIVDAINCLEDFE